ncbi:vitamin K-dependent protein Z-like [Seriola lalandi dorsalis]|uniref:vitamin K-dependent protein Z-like n=1 Tax=Seriola lalandi dorsalis TaxID=1841481 RepID=UPI000C6F9B1C|nr:vitamin K-dependent protein Z-like [Seriola lalandi dorsalis]
MAVSIMSACCRASVLSLHLLACFLQVFSQGEVFRQAPQAHAVFLRSKRANMFLVEEILPGNLERECYEELCSFEEARECFEDYEKTTAFWTVYYDGDQCESNPCLNGGNCTDKVGGFLCSCPPPHFGPACELSVKKRVVRPSFVPPEIAECPTDGPTACHQLCTASHYSFTCSCMPGFKLQADKRSCLPEVDFPCGRLPAKFNTTTSMCRHGHCPWQVSLLNSRGVEICAGVVLGRRSVLTAARCLFLDSGSDLQPSNLYVVAGNDKVAVRVRALYVHDRFRSDHHHDNLALLGLSRPLTFSPTLIHLCLPNKDFSENILMHSGRTGITGRRRSGRNQDLVYMTLDECRSQMNVSHPLSNKMFCMRTHNRPVGNQNGAQERPSGVARRRRSGHSGRNQTHSDQSGQSGARRTPNQENENSHSSNQKPSVSVSGLRSEVGSRGCGDLLLGAPVATVEQGTAYLTGLLMSSSAGCDDGSYVFTKLSRYLSWIRPRLEVAEDHMTPQVNQYPETR